MEEESQTINNMEEESQTINNEQLAVITDMLQDPDPNKDFIIGFHNLSINGNMKIDLNKILNDLIEQRATNLGMTKEAMSKKANYLIYLTNNNVTGSVQFGIPVTTTITEKFDNCDNPADTRLSQESDTYCNNFFDISSWNMKLFILIILVTILLIFVIVNKEKI